MIQIIILEDNDIVLSNDYCRPLELDNNYGDCINTRSTYSGTPTNNVKWTLVSNVFGSCWFNKKVKDIIKQPSKRYEFVRGTIPQSHILKDY